MNIITKRTLIIPFTIQMIAAAKNRDYSTLESLGIISGKDWPEPDLIEALPVFEQLLRENGTNGFGLWLIKDRFTNNVIGSSGFLGNPDIKGHVEIGFGIAPAKRHNGYCTEVIKGMLEWVKSASEVTQINARCENTNKDSKNVLNKCGFRETVTDNNFTFWEYVI